MNTHIGLDEFSSLVQHLKCTAAHVADITQAHKLLHGREDTISADIAYIGAHKREELQGVKAAWDIAEKLSKCWALKKARVVRMPEALKASVRAIAEYPPGR